MIGKWNASAFGAPKEDETYKDVWGPIQDSEEYDIVETVEDSGKWFVPSIAEWDAFFDAFDVDSSNYSDTYGLSDFYWSSSQDDPIDVWLLDFDMDGTYDAACSDWGCIRLSAAY